MDHGVTQARLQDESNFRLSAIVYVLVAAHWLCEIAVKILGYNTTYLGVKIPMEQYQGLQTRDCDSQIRFDRKRTVEKLL